MNEMKSRRIVGCEMQCGNFHHIACIYKIDKKHPKGIMFW